jgi:hypothetical protein
MNQLLYDQSLLYSSNGYHSDFIIIIKMQGRGNNQKKIGLGADIDF